jgi:hypothetical protein
MERWATKDRYEEETEESERLIHPAPKVKPPRHDKRRERMNPDRDPDIADDPDIAHDKDLSLNYKNVGGSLAGRVLSRHLGFDPLTLNVASRFFKADTDRKVQVVKKDTGLSSEISQKWYDTHKSEYELVGEKEEGEPKGSPSENDEEGGEQEEAAPGRKQIDEETSEKVLDLAKRNAPLSNLLRSLADPKDKEHTTWTSLPDLPLATITSLKGISFPPGVKTVRDLQDVADTTKSTKEKSGKPPKAPKGQKPQAPTKPAPPPPAKAKPGEAPAKPGAPKPGEAPQGRGPLAPDIPDSDWSAYESPPSREDTDALKSWVGENGPEKPEFKEWANKLETVDEGEDGTLLFPKGKKKVPFDQLSTAEQTKVKSQFEKDVKSDRNVEALKSLTEDPQAKKVIRDLANPRSDLRERIDSMSRNKRLDLSQAVVKKVIPELANVKMPPGVSSVQDLIDAAERGFGPPAEPKRPKASKDEGLRADASISETFPEGVSEEVSNMDLHPTDVSHLISGYRAAMRSPTKEGSYRGPFSLNPESIEPPEYLGVNGQKKRFVDLSPEQQSEAFAQYKTYVLASSLALRQKTINSLKENGLPDGPSKDIATAILKSGGKDIPDEEVEAFYAKSLAKSFGTEPLKDRQVEELLKAAEDNPAARKLIGAFVQSQHYAEARNRFLTGSPDDTEKARRERISEWDDPETIADKLRKASDFLKKKGEVLPTSARVVDPAMSFRNRIMDRMNALSGEKVPIIREYLRDYEMKDYEEKKASHDQNQGAYKKALAKEEQAIKEEQGAGPKGEPAKEGGDPYRSPAEPESEALPSASERLAAKGIYEPTEPVPPPGYEDWKHQSSSEDNAEEAVSWLKGFWNKVRRKSSSLDPDPVLFRVLARTLVPSMRQRVALCHEVGVAYSSYPTRWTMGQNPSNNVRTAIYWGQEPYQDTAPYPGWSQLHARDFDAADFNNILTAAREWLKLPVLGREIQGLYRDTQVRAALDLALRDHENGKYSVGLYPTIYNELLAKLSGCPGPYELQTGQPKDVPVAGVQASKSTYGDTTRREVQTMKASAQVRMFASRAATATKDPELSFDLMEFAEHLASEEAQAGQGQQQSPEKSEQQKQAAIRIAAITQNKFDSVKALVVRQAVSHPELREVFLPILQALKV